MQRKMSPKTRRRRDREPNQETRLVIDEDGAANQETRLQRGSSVPDDLQKIIEMMALSAVGSEQKMDAKMDAADLKLVNLVQKICQSHVMVDAEGTFIGRVRKTVSSLSDTAKALLSVDPGSMDDKHIFKQLLCMLNLKASRSYLRDIIEKVWERIDTKEFLFHRMYVLFLELEDYIMKLQGIENNLHESLVVCHDIRNSRHVDLSTHVDLSVEQIMKELEEDIQPIALNDHQEQPQASVGFSILKTGETPSSQASVGFSILETGETPSFQFADLKMPILRNNEAAGGRRVTRYDLEVTDVVGELEALSGIPPANLQKQVVTKEGLLLVWEQGEEPLAQKVAANSRGTHVVSARLTGVDQNLRGRVGYQFCSPLNGFDLEEESSIQPGRHTDDQTTSLVTSANVLSVKVVDSAKGFPVSLYGSIFVRDSLDNKRVYLFRRDRDNAQHINSPDESLMLNGPSRGLFVFVGLFFEIDLKMIRDQLGDDMDFSQGTISYDSVISTQPGLVSEELWSPLSTIELNYALAHSAVEAYIEIQIIKDSSSSSASTVNVDEKKGCVDNLCGKITACITGMPEEMVLFDSDASDSTITIGADGMLDLWCRIISVPIWDSLLLRLETWDRDGDREADLCRVATTFSPVLCGEERALVPCCGYMMQISVFWCPLYIQKLDEELLKGNSCWRRFRH